MQESLQAAKTPLEQANVELAMANQCTVLRGDAVELLPAALDAIPAHLLPVVTDTYTAVFFSDEDRRRLLDVLAE